MQLDSYLEIFTTMYGWAFANIIGEVLSATGLVVLPFMLIVFNGWREAKESGAENITISGLIESVGTKLILAMFVFSMCFATSPIASLLNINLKHQPPPTLTDPSPAEVSRDSGTASTYDAAMANSINGSMSNSQNLSYVPVWWYSIMAISSGFNSSVKAGIQNSGNNMRMVEELARTATIEDPVLLRNIQRFYSECFAPALAKYNNMPVSGLSTAGQALVIETNTDYGPADVAWMGSQLFRTEPGFYDSMRSVNAVPGFAVDFTRDTEYYDPASGIDPPFAGQVNPDWGRPTCKEWWEGPQGVREGMINQSAKWRQLASASVNFFANADKSKDAVARLAQTQADPHYVDPTQAFGNQHETNVNMTRLVGGIASVVGTGILSFLTNISIGPLKEGLLMMQALTLMGMFTFLPMIVFLSGYNLNVMLYGAIGIFTVKFWAVLWFIANWVDGNLMSAMYPSGSFDWEFLVPWLSNNTKRLLLNILLLGMFIGLPALWSGMMAWVGVNVGKGMDTLIKGSEKTSQNTAKPLKALF